MGHILIVSRVMAPFFTALFMYKFHNYLKPGTDLTLNELKEPQLQINREFWVKIYVPGLSIIPVLNRYTRYNFIEPIISEDRGTTLNSSPKLGRIPFLQIGKYQIINLLLGFLREVRI